MPDLTTLTGVHAELAATADYDVEPDVAKAKRRVAALRRVLDFPNATGGDSQSVAFDTAVTERQLQQALGFVRAYAAPTDAQLLANPDVVHADFSTFQGYQ